MPGFYPGPPPRRGGFAPAHPRLRVGDAVKTWMPGSRPGMTAETRGRPASKVAEHLRPDGDHTDEQRQRRQRGGFLDHGFEHGSLPEQRENIIHGMFLVKVSCFALSKGCS